MAGMLGTSTAAVNGALQRARSTLSVAVPTQGEIVEPGDARTRAAVNAYAAAFEAADVEALVALLTEDAVLEMPPVPLWYRGRHDYRRFLERVFALRGTGWRMRPVSANGQPALAAYCRGAAGHELHTLQVLTVTAAGIAHNVVFQDPSVVTAFRLAPTPSDGR